MSDWKFHCDVLCVSESASPEEIKNAFRKLALRFHPDRNGGSAASKEKFQRVNVSYHYLMKNLAFRPQPAPRAEAPPPPRERKYREEPPPFFQKALRNWKQAKVFQRLSRIPKDTWLQLLPVPVAVVAAIFMLGDHLTRPELGSPFRAPAAASKKDDFGRKVATCETMRFSGGNLTKKWSGESTETDCELKCAEWFDSDITADGTCLWNKNEFRQQAAKKANGVLVAPVVVPEEHSRKFNVQIILNDSPDILEKVPTQHRIIPLNHVDEFAFDFQPKIWIGDSSMMEAKQIDKTNSVKFYPIKIGEVSVVFTDEENNIKGLVLYTIETTR